MLTWGEYGIWNSERLANSGNAFANENVQCEWAVPHEGTQVLAAHLECQAETRGCVKRRVYPVLDKQPFWADTSLLRPIIFTTAFHLLANSSKLLFITFILFYLVSNCTFNDHVCYVVTSLGSLLIFRHVFCTKRQRSLCAVTSL